MNKTLWQVIVILALVLAIILFLKGCPKKAVMENIVPADTIENRAKQIDDTLKSETDVDSVLSAKTRDTLDKVISDLKKYKALTISQEYDIDVLLQELNKQPSDSSTKLSKRVKELMAAGRIKDSLCDKTIKLKDNVIKSKNLALVSKDTAYKRLRRLLDLCTSQQKTIVAKNQDLQNKDKAPKLYVGVSAIGNSQTPFYMFGGTIAVETKNGFMFEGGVYGGKPGTMIMVGIKQRIKL